MNRGRFVVGAAVVLSVAAFVGSASGAGAGGVSGAAAAAGPIKVGAISSLTGPVPFPESSAAAKAVFDQVNATGGINGRKIKYIVADDKADPALAAQAARRLVDQDGVVGMAGSASLLECAVNAAFYKQKGVYAIQGTGVDPVCFNSPNISAVNTGPYLGTTAGLYFASEVLKDTKVCMIFYNIPGFESAVKQSVARWTAITGKELTYFDMSLGLADDPTPQIVKAKEKGCQAIVHNGLEAHAIVWGKALKAQGLTVHEIALTSAYTDKVAKELAQAGAEGIYANSEFEPYLSSSPALKDWRALMKKARVPQTSFAEGGYLAATFFVQALRTINGPITRKSVAAALLRLKPIKHPMVGSPYSFGRGSAHNPNRASKFVQVQNGRWVVVTPKWLVLPTA
ncbi:Periplasmic binding protein [Gaiella occulta]|uniref:Periplasmic binding protein n=1 Tax=Gaiella occulta TaxID=1002870 RepID=A0A7M2YWA9_9ACTN|nr:Periplasmic binding protein [Gaiella occulta]